MRSSEPRAVHQLVVALAPAAVLLADEPDAAVRLLITGLRASPSPNNADDALRGLVRVAVQPPRWAAEQVIESRQPGIPADDDLALAGAWRLLDVRDRGAVVLELLGGPAAPDADGARTRLEALVADRDEEERRERARSAALYRRPGTVLDPEPPLPDLGERLIRLAAGRPLPANAAETVETAIREADRLRRRRRARLAAGAVGLAVFLALLPFLPRGAEPPKPASVYAGPTRGSLAGDGGFLRAVARSGWALAEETPGPRRVVFAGDVPGGRWVLLAAGGSSSRPATTAWFTGPAGARPDALELLAIRVAPDPAEPVAVTDPATGALAVVGAAGDRLRVSERPQVTAGGSVTRRFHRLPTSGGVAVAALPGVPRAVVSPVRLEATRDGRRVDVPSPTVVGIPGTPQAVGSPTLLRPAPAPAPGDAAAEPRLRAVLGQLGEPVATTPVTTLWSGDLPGPNDQPARLAVLAVPQPSGAVVVTTPYGYAADLSGRAGSSWCGTGVLPAGVPLAQRVVAVRCDLSDLSVEREISRFLVIVAPPGAPSMRLLDAGGAVLREGPLADGIAVVRSPGDVAQVEVMTADGGSTSVRPVTNVDLAD